MCDELSVKIKIPKKRKKSRAWPRVAETLFKTKKCKRNSQKEQPNVLFVQRWVRWQLRRKWRCHKPSKCDPNFYEKIKEKKRVLFAKKPEAIKKKKPMDAMNMKVPEESDSDEWWMSKVRDGKSESRSPFMITMALTFTIGMLKFKKANAFAFLDTIIILLMVHHKFYDQPMLGNDSTYIPKKNQNQGWR